ncbi:hypothetical protein CK203_054454 [Vitis vinifera]|uniref:Uncharacterized protein n=1 Tax=Vitis vinifera TaxID=29760 RepID=A0A438GZT7_VITVI|nr:hypothetical protein CK203_054454 [Vitis vinifera]
MLGSFKGFFSYILAFKLKALEMDLKAWNKEVVGSVVVRKELMFFELKGEKSGGLVEEGE